MQITATRRDAYKLLHEGVLALADVEHNGIQIDVDYCKKKRTEILRKMKKLKGKLDDVKEVKTWKRIKGEKFNIGSNQQLGEMLFKHLGHKPEKRTKTNRPSVDDDAMKKLNIPWVKDILKLRSLEKMEGTYLRGILRETCNGFLHPIFNLHLVKTYRSSSDHPNSQNFPVRIPELAKLVRSAVIARPGRQIGELDYKGIEVCSNQWYHHDPVMLEYIEDPEKDMHRDQAMECYLLPAKQVTKDARYCGKNNFVFPEFYGDYHASCAQSLWGSIKKLKLKRVDGMPMREHLREEGIGNYRQFEHHIAGVEDRFWNERFQVYGAWKEEQYERYLRTGYIDMLTGFRCQGVMKKNEAINYAGQGTAFHCLLWSLIRLNRWLRKNKMDSLIIGQIHDSILNDFVPDELAEVLAAAQRIMTKEIREYWEWITTTLVVDVEIAPVGGSWYDLVPCPDVPAFIAEQMEMK